MEIVLYGQDSYTARCDIRKRLAKRFNMPYVKPSILADADIADKKRVPTSILKAVLAANGITIATCTIHNWAVRGYITRRKLSRNIGGCEYWYSLVELDEEMQQRRHGRPYYPKLDISALYGQALEEIGKKGWDRWTL